MYMLLDFRVSNTINKSFMCKMKSMIYVHLIVYIDLKS